MTDADRIVRVTEGQPLPGGFVRMIQSYIVANNDGGTGTHMEYDLIVSDDGIWISREDADAIERILAGEIAEGGGTDATSIEGILARLRAAKGEA